MNPWTSPPSPSVDASSSDPSTSSAFPVGWHVASTLPRWLWDAYVTYLWYYRPDSWIGRVASTFRVLAVMLVLPVVLLTLLDVTSYVIARTLGVVDDVKASTSDADAVTTATSTTPDGGKGAVAVAVPVTTSLASSHDVGVSARTSEGRASEDFGGDGNGRGCASGTSLAAASTLHGQTRTRTQTQTRGDRQVSETPPHAYYFAGDEDLRLAGEGVFSPAASMPPSPLTPRMPLHTFTEDDGREVGQAIEEGIVLRRRAQGVREDEGHHA